MRSRCCWSQHLILSRQKCYPCLRYASAKYGREGWGFEPQRGEPVNARKLCLRAGNPTSKTSKSKNRQRAVFVNWSGRQGELGIRAAMRRASERPKAVLEGRQSCRTRWSGIVKLVGTAGFEPATTTPPVWCATRLRYAPKVADYTQLRRGCEVP